MMQTGSTRPAGPLAHEPRGAKGTVARVTHRARTSPPSTRPRPPTVRGRRRAAFSGPHPPAAGAWPSAHDAGRGPAMGGVVTPTHTAGRAGSATSARRDTTRIRLATPLPLRRAACRPCPLIQFPISPGAAVYNHGWARPTAPSLPARRDVDDPPPPIPRRSAPSPGAAVSRGGQRSASVRPRQGDPYEYPTGETTTGWPPRPPRASDTCPRAGTGRDRGLAPRAQWAAGGGVSAAVAARPPHPGAAAGPRGGPKRRGDLCAGAPARRRRLPSITLPR